MPDIVVYIACSLDGYIATPTHGLDWLTRYDSPDEDYGYQAFYQSIDGMVMGSGTYPHIPMQGGWPYAGKPCWVVSHRPLASHHPDVLVTAASPEALRDEMAQRGLKRVWMIGGGKLIASFREKGLIHEYIITVIPTILGAGIPLFPTPGPAEALRLAESRTYPNGLVQLRYLRVEEG